MLINAKKSDEYSSLQLYYDNREICIPNIHNTGNCCESHEATTRLALKFIGSAVD